MRTLPLAILAAICAAFVLTGPAMIARQQPTSASLEYLVVTPYRTTEQVAQGIRYVPAYNACVAADGGWACRQFEPPAGASRTTNREPDGALRAVLATLGAEGWELVTAVDDTPNQGEPTYLFKRPQ